MGCAGPDGRPPVAGARFDDPRKAFRSTCKRGRLSRKVAPGALTARAPYSKYQDYGFGPYCGFMRICMFQLRDIDKTCVYACFNSGKRRNMHICMFPSARPPAERTRHSGIQLQGLHPTTRVAPNYRGYSQLQGLHPTTGVTPNYGLHPTTRVAPNYKSKAGTVSARLGL